MVSSYSFSSSFLSSNCHGPTLSDTTKNLTKLCHTNTPSLKQVQAEPSGSKVSHHNMWCIKYQESANTNFSIKKNKTGCWKRNDEKFKNKSLLIKNDQLWQVLQSNICGCNSKKFSLKKKVSKINPNAITLLRMDYVGIKRVPSEAWILLQEIVRLRTLMVLQLPS